MLQELINPELINEQLKPSQILRKVAAEGKYKWIKYCVDQGDGIHRCALGAIYGYLGWKGWEGDRFDPKSENFRHYVNKTIEVFGGDDEQYTASKTMWSLAEYNNLGHDYNGCAVWLEEKGL